MTGESVSVYERGVIIYESGKVYVGRYSNSRERTLVGRISQNSDGAFCFLSVFDAVAQSEPGVTTAVAYTIVETNPAILHQSIEQWWKHTWTELLSIYDRTIPDWVSKEEVDDMAEVAHNVRKNVEDELETLKESHEKLETRVIELYREKEDLMATVAAMKAIIPKKGEVEIAAKEMPEEEAFAAPTTPDQEVLTAGFDETNIPSEDNEGTVRWWFRRVADPNLRQRLFEALNKAGKLRGAPDTSQIRYPLLQDALGFAFDFKDTAEGFQFWSDVRMKARRDEIPMIPGFEPPQTSQEC